MIRSGKTAVVGDVSADEVRAVLGAVPRQGEVVVVPWTAPRLGRVGDDVVTGVAWVVEA